MGHVYTKTNQQVKYECSVKNSSQDTCNERKPFFSTRDTYDLDL